MLFWPAVTLIGFLLLTGLVIAMGSSSTARYEREQQAARARRPVGAAAPDAVAAGARSA